VLKKRVHPTRRSVNANRPQIIGRVVMYCNYLIYKIFLFKIALGFAAAGTCAETMNHPSVQTHCPIIIAHRGASGYRPEHTLASYELAIRMGADYIEPDLVATRDGVLVARHENEISETTDVAQHPEFAGRKTTKHIDGRVVQGWFTEDFSYAELKTLRARERLPDIRPNNTAYDGLYTIPSLQEILDLLREHQADNPGHAVGIYPETKHPSYFAGLGLSLEEPLVMALHKNGYRGREAKVFIQSFEVGNLKKLRHMTELPLVQLMDAAGQPYDVQAAGDPRGYADMATAQGLKEIATYANAVGPNKNLIIPRNAQDGLTAETRFVRDAHAAGLKVHAWTFRAENEFQAADFRTALLDTHEHRRRYAKLFPGEFQRFFAIGIDGLFTDHTDIAMAAWSFFKP
jgi:glycerophosphoryl diester phosphodiesterase